MIRFLLLACSLIVGSMSCTDNPKPTPSLPTPVEDLGNFDGVEDLKLDGTLDTTEFDDVVAGTQSVYFEGDFFNVEGATDLGTRAVMLSVTGRRLEDILVPGNTEMTYTFAAGDLDGPTLTLLGCVGQAIDTYDMYDEPAENVALTVRPGGTSRALPVTVTGTWRSGRTATASFTLTR